MDFEQERQRAEGIEVAAVELYRNDPRIRMLINSCLGMARQIEGPIDPEYIDRDVTRVALHALSLLAARILHEDAELRNARAESEHYRKLVEGMLYCSARTIFVPSGVNEFPQFVDQVRRDSGSRAKP